MESKFTIVNSIKELRTEGEIKMLMELIKVRIKELTRNAIQFELEPLENLLIETYLKQTTVGQRYRGMI